MATSLNEVRQLSITYAGFQRIPKDVLKKNRLVRIVDQNGTVRVVPKKAMRIQVKSVAGILDKFRGYLCEYDHAYLVAVLEGKRVLDKDAVASAEDRAKAFKDADIPPMFDSVFFGFGEGASEGCRKEPFPVANFIMQYTTGVLNGRRASRMTNALPVLGEKRVEGVTVAMRPCTVKDVQRFCAVAFDEYGSIILPLIREVLYQVSMRFHAHTPENKERALKNARLAFAFLEKSLRHLALREPRSYIVWDGNAYVVETPRWFLAYAPADHGRIAAAYLASVQAVPAWRERRVIERTLATFPDLVPPKNLQTGANPILRALAELNFLNLERMLFEPGAKDSRIYDAALKHFGNLCTAWAEKKDKTDETVLCSIIELGRIAKIPVQVIRMDPFRKLLNQARMTVLKSLSEEEFRERFRSRKGKLSVGRFGCGAKGDGGNDKTIHIYVRTRLRELN